MDRSSNVCESDSVSSSSAASSTDIFFDELMHTVHTLTSDIENDFEKLIDQHGRNGLHAVRSKVISALELLLETCNNQKDNRQVVKELHYKVRLLESEKAVNCIGYENLLAEMEKDYKKKLEEQLKFKAHLLQENEKLSSALSSALQRERDSKEDDKQSEIELVMKAVYYSIKPFNPSYILNI